MDDGDRANLLGATAEEGGLPRVRSGGHGGVATDALSDPARHGQGGLGGGTPTAPPGGDQTYRVSFPKRLLQIW